MPDPAVTVTQFRTYISAAAAAVESRDWDTAYLKLGAAAMILPGLEKEMASSGESFKFREELSGAYAALEKTKAGLSQSTSTKRIAYAVTTYGRRG